jgi:hypothetical protein
MNFLKKHGHWLLTLFVAFVFIQSLFFKFTGSPETVYIFQGKLDPWAASLVGSAELVASMLLLAGAFIAQQRLVQVAGAALGLGVISGAIFFHLFTPLGIAVINTDGSSDGGELFMLACGVWVSCALLLWIRRDVWLAFLTKLLGR